MKIKIRDISTSLTTAFVLFLFLSAIFGYGSYIAALKDVKPIFKKMTATHIWSALDAIWQHQLVLYWLIVLVMVAVALFGNTLCCTWRQLCQYRKSHRATKASKRLLRMVLIHIAALTVIVFHGLDVMLVERHLPQKIGVGESKMLNGYTIKVEAIEYVTDTKYIRENERGRRQPSFKIPYGKFSIEKNKAKLALYFQGQLVQRADIRIFSPIRIGSTFFFLDGFYLPHDSDQIGISIHGSKNPLVLAFFIVYACLFTLLLWHGIANRVALQNKEEEKTT